MTTVFAAAPESPSQIPRYPRGEGYGALVGDKWVRLAATPDQPVRFYTRDSLAQRSDDTGSVYENVLDIGYSFGRGDLSGGEGLDWSPRFISQLDDSEARDKIRYWDSENIDIRRPVRGELARITMSKEFDVWTTQAGMADLATSDLHLFVAYGTTLEWWDDWDAGVPVDSDQASSTILRIESSNAGDVAVLLDDNTLEYKAADEALLAPVPGLVDVQRHWFVKGRFVAFVRPAGGVGSLVEFDAAGEIGAGPFDTFDADCLSMVSSGPAVVAAISDGTVRSYVPEQSNQLDPASVSLVVRGVSDMPEGEIAYLLGSNADILLILTRTTGDSADNDIRLYQAEVLDARYDYVVGARQLRREWENTASVAEPRKNMANTRDEIWFMVHEEATDQMLWRFDLVTFGLSRHVTIPGISSAWALVLFDKRGGFISGTSIYRTQDTFVDEGWLITPNITFGVNTDINFIALVAAATGLSAAGKQVELWYSTDPEAILDEAHPSWRLSLRMSNDAQSNIEQFLTSVTATQCALMIRMFSSEVRTKAANVNNFALRGLPKHRDWILELPVNISDIIEVPGRRPVTIPTYGDIKHREMLGLEGASIEIQVFDPPFGFRGVVDNILEPTAYISDRGSASVRCVLQCRGTRLTATASATGDEGLGIGTLGISTLGIGQSERT